MNNINHYVCCVICKSDIKKRGNLLICKKCKKEYKVKDGIIQMLPVLTSDQEFSIAKWDKFYKDQERSGGYKRLYDIYFSLFHDKTYRQIKEAFKFNKNTIYLEIGSGDLFLGSVLAKECKIIIGIDFSMESLKLAKKLLGKNKSGNYLLIQADILRMPLKDNVIDFIYGGGVIEHFKDTQSCIVELYRVLKKGGVSFNTVPYLNLGSLTYRQLWGNIPNFPLFKQLAEFVHIKVLGGKHMIYGYEYSFPGFLLRSLHERAGFKKIEIKRFDITVVFDFLPKMLRPPLIYLAEKSRLFWPMVKVIAIK